MERSRKENGKIEVPGEDKSQTQKIMAWMQLEMRRGPVFTQSCRLVVLNVDPSTAVLTSPGICWKCEFLGPTSDSESIALRIRPSNLRFNKISKNSDARYSLRTTVV